MTQDATDPTCYDTNDVARLITQRDEATAELDDLRHNHRTACDLLADKRATIIALRKELEHVRRLAGRLADRLEHHAHCDTHTERKPAADCPFCADRSAYQAWQAGLGSVPDRAQDSISLAEECRIGAYAIRDAIGAVLAYGPGADWPALLKQHAQVWEETGKTRLVLERAVIDAARTHIADLRKWRTADDHTELEDALADAVDALNGAVP